MKDYGENGFSSSMDREGDELCYHSILLYFGEWQTLWYGTSFTGNTIGRSIVIVSFPVMCRRLYGCVGKSRTGREDKKEFLFIEEHPELLTYCL